MSRDCHQYLSRQQTCLLKAKLSVLTRNLSISGSHYLLCPRTATWPPGHARSHVLTGLPLGHLGTLFHTLTLPQLWNTVAPAYLFARLPHLRVTKWCPGHTSLKAFFVPGVPCGKLGMAVCTRTLLRQRSLMFTGTLCPSILTCLFAHTLFPRTATRWHCSSTYTWQSRLACSQAHHVPALPLVARTFGACSELD